jgi:DNA-binding beta-propeller fold protein YncE
MDRRSAISMRRVYVADRRNSRIQVFDQNGNFISAWYQFGQPSSVFVGPDDRIYVGVALRDEATRRNASSQVQPGEQRGIVVGNALDGSLLAFIPDPSDLGTVGAGTSASGIAADAMGNVYAADVGAHKVRKYILSR